MDSLDAITNAEAVPISFGGISKGSLITNETKSYPIYAPSSLSGGAMDTGNNNVTTNSPVNSTPQIYVLNLGNSGNEKGTSTKEVSGVYETKPTTSENSFDIEKIFNNKNFVIIVVILIVAFMIKKS